METPLTEFERKKYVMIAKNFLYPDEVITKISKAKTEEEVERILIDERHSKP